MSTTTISTQRTRAVVRAQQVVLWLGIFTGLWYVMLTWVGAQKWRYSAV